MCFRWHVYVCWWALFLLCIQHWKLDLLPNCPYCVLFELSTVSPVWPQYIYSDVILISPSRCDNVKIKCSLFCRYQERLAVDLSDLRKLLRSVNGCMAESCRIGTRPVAVSTLSYASGTGLKSPMEYISPWPGSKHCCHRHVWLFTWRCVGVPPEVCLNFNLYTEWFSYAKNGGSCGVQCCERRRWCDACHYANSPALVDPNWAYPGI